ncbi:MAG: DUF4249 domain-containing protein [Tannerella sp.]|jgi:hypothetical protein|nr:DUF4249 domain-containing protein [Tannerella sp.]
MKSFLFAVCGLLVISSCIKELQLPVDETEQTVVNCTLTNDSIQTLSLTKSVKLGEEYKFQKIISAQISLAENGIDAGKFLRLSAGQWQLRFTPKAGAVYTLTVKLSDGKTLTATTTMPSPASIQDLGDNTPFSKNFSQNKTGNPYWIFVLNSDTSNNRPSGAETLKMLIGTDHIHADRFNEDGNMKETIPSATTPAFRAYVRIPATDTDVKFCLQARYQHYSLIAFRTASYEYDRYLKTSLQKMYVYLDESDPTIWYDESRIYSNIQNGVGIFAAYHDQYILYFDKP